MNTGYVSSLPVSQVDAETRSTFITRTYLHLLGAILAFVAIEVFLFQSGLAESIARTMFQFSWLIILGLFMLVGWLATHLASNTASKAAQYGGLALYVVVEALIFVPLLYLAMSYEPRVINSAAQVTLLGFGALTAVAFMTRKDFSFLRGILFWGFILAIVAIVAAAIFGFNLGTFFSVAMVGLAGAAILYDTSNVIHHYPEDRYVGAALQLFASVALMFWYVLSIFMSRD